MQKSAEVWKRVVVAARLNVSVEEVHCQPLLGKVWRRSRAPAREHFHLNLLTAYVLPAASQRSWISLASVVTSQQLRHIQRYEHRRWCVWVLVRAHTVHAHPMSRSSCSPKWVMAELQEHWLENVWVRPRLLSVCAENGSMTRRRLGCGKRDVTGFRWNPLTHETKQSAHVVFPTCQRDEL